MLLIINAFQRKKYFTVCLENKPGKIGTRSNPTFWIFLIFPNFHSNLSCQPSFFIWLLLVDHKGFKEPQRCSEGASEKNTGSNRSSVACFQANSLPPLLLPRSSSKIQTNIARLVMHNFSHILQVSGVSEYLLGPHPNWNVIFFVYSRLKWVSQFLLGVLLNIAKNSVCIASL